MNIYDSKANLTTAMGVQTQNEPVGRVRGEQEGLEKNLHELADLCAVLERRLEPVLLPANSEADGDSAKTPEPQRSPVAYHANYMANMAAGHAARLRGILNRLDV
jgi:hypothetical protein